MVYEGLMEIEVMERKGREEKRGEEGRKRG
jgi:hypothetical protein